MCIHELLGIHISNFLWVAVHRKRLLLAFALQGAFAAILFLILPSSSPLWFLSALLAICANVGFGVSVVAMNAYLPSLAKDSREVAELRSQLKPARMLETQISLIPATPRASKNLSYQELK